MEILTSTLKFSQTLNFKKQKKSNFKVSNIYKK
jgi:hypothetical protein